VGDEGQAQHLGPLHQGLHRQGERGVPEGPRERVLGRGGREVQGSGDQGVGRGQQCLRAPVRLQVGPGHSGKLLWDGQQGTPRALRLRVGEVQEILHSALPSACAQVNCGHSQGKH